MCTAESQAQFGHSNLKWFPSAYVRIPIYSQIRFWFDQDTASSMGDIDAVAVSWEKFLLLVIIYYYDIDDAVVQVDFPTNFG